MVETIFILVGPSQSRSCFQSHPKSLKILAYGTWRLQFGFIYSANEVCRRFLAHHLCDYLPNCDVADIVLESRILMKSHSLLIIQFILELKRLLCAY